jgi:hypothetical protein
VTALARRADAKVQGATMWAVDVSPVAGLTEACRGAEGVFFHLPIGWEADRESCTQNIVAALRETRPLFGNPWGSAFAHLPTQR